MNISCSTDNLKKALQATLKAVSNKAVLPVLNNLLVTNQNVSGGYLKLVAIDLEIGIEVLIEKAFVVAKILVTFHAIVQNKHFAVFNGVQSAGIYI